MYLKILKISENLYQEAHSFFDDMYIQELKNKENYKASLIARYMISQHIWDNYLPQVSSCGIPKYQNEKNWSISHKNDIIFVWVNELPLGLDIEYVKCRDISLLDIFSQSEYNILWGKNWMNFYTLWTAHEALLKFHKETTYESWMYILTSFYEEENTLWSITFHRKVQLLFKWDIYTIYVWIESQYIYSLCSQIWKK